MKNQGISMRNKANKYKTEKRKRGRPPKKEDEKLVYKIEFRIDVNTYRRLLKKAGRGRGGISRFCRDLLRANL